MEFINLSSTASTLLITLYSRAAMSKKNMILSDKKAEEIKGQADAEAAAIYAEAYDVDKEFYSFWKSLESYKQTFSKFDATFTTDMDYFDYLYSAEGNR